MSLYYSQTLRAIIPPAVALRAGRRTFTTSPLARKSIVDSAKDGLKAVDRSVSDTLVKGIETGGTFCAFFVLCVPLSVFWCFSAEGGLLVVVVVMFSLTSVRLR